MNLALLQVNFKIRQPFILWRRPANENWSGMLDDIAIWDRALSGAEVAELNADGITFGGATRSPGWPAWQPMVLELVFS